MILKRLVIAFLIPGITGLAFEAPPTVSDTPLCHNDVAVESESFMDVKEFLSINALCPTMLPAPINRRKMAFTTNPYRSDSLTLSDGVMLARCMLARGIVMAHNGITTGIDTSQKKISSTIDSTQKKIVNTIDTTTSKSQQLLETIMSFANERFTFADHVLPEKAGFSNGIALMIAAIFALAVLSLELHQRTLAKLSKDDDRNFAKVEAQLRKKRFDDDAFESTNSATENIVNRFNENIQASELPSVTEEPVAIEKDARETASEESDDGSTFLQSPPPTPPRYVVDMKMKEEAAKANLETGAASPKRKRKFGFRLRRKNRNKIKN
jgi:hypothetical protein